ncbi:enolase C-terminal domain-like protein [Gammaproteobacteria bacterium]|nr:enolase C-terminal domain-like protein [Gammaproteobacteria bacterium]
MKITKLSVFQVDLPLSKPYWLSGGRLRVDHLDASLLKMETDQGLIGWGEGTPWGHTYIAAHGPGIRAGIETMAPFIIGLDPRQVLALERAMDVALPGHLYAKSPLDMAAWDIKAQAEGLPLAASLGAVYDGDIPVASSISTDTPEAMLRNVQSYRDRGYCAHSVKVGADVEADIARIRFLETNKAANEHLLYDVNRAWTRQQAIRVMNAVADLGITVEQPGETIDDLAAIRRQTDLPISIDERLETLQDAVRVAKEGIAEVFNIKLNRVGGLTRAARIRDIAMSYGIDCYVMATGGSVLADSEAMHLAQTLPVERRLAVWACQDMLTVDIAPGQGIRSRNGMMQVGNEIGLGVAPDEALLGRPVAVYRPA